jgi:hypothetical protein
MYRALIALVSVTFVVGCGKASPTSPLSGSATITGSLVGSAAPSAGVAVSVVGGGAGATVDATNHFTLTNVPSGNVSLKFSGTGLGSQVTLGTIGAAEKVSVTITRNGSSLTLEMIHHRNGDRDEVEGPVDGLPPTTAPGTFTVSGLPVQTNANTKFFKGDAAGTFADLAVGLRVEVKGTPSATGVLASTVKIQRATPDPGVEVDGLIAGFSGVPTAFQFTVNGQTVKGDQTTVFDEGTTFASLVNGARVKVKGLSQTGFIFATKIDVEGSSGVTVKGLIAGFSGVAAEFQFTVNGQTVKGDQTTVFDKGTTFASLVNGARVEVDGLSQTGFIFATKIDVERSWPDVPLDETEGVRS